MSSRRMLKAAEAIREVVASSILTELRDPRVQNVTVVSVAVTPDMREATVGVSVMGDETQKQLTVRGLQNSAGFLQSKIANRLDTRYTPKLRFEIDRGQENAMAVGEILARIRREQDEAAMTSPDVGDGDRDESNGDVADRPDPDRPDPDRPDPDRPDPDRPDPDRPDPGGSSSIP